MGFPPMSTACNRTMHAEPRGYLLPLGPVIKHTGPISGPLPLYARVAGTRLHACNQIPERDWKKKVGDTVTTWVSGPHAIPLYSLWGSSPQGNSIDVHCLHDMPENTRNPHIRSTPVLKGGPTGSRPENSTIRARFPGP